MLKRTCFLLLLIALLASAAHAQDRAVVKRARGIAEQGKYAEALDLLEPELEHSIGSPSNEYDGFKNDLEFSGVLPPLMSLPAYMARLYREGDLEERGVAFMNKVYTDAATKKLRADRDLEDALIDVALAAKKFDVALAVVDRQKKREDFWGWDLTYARIYAASGRTDDALAKLRSYLSNTAADSRSRVLARAEFEPLYANTSFRDIIAESEELVKARYAAYAMPSTTEPPPSTAADVLKAAAIYAEVKDQESGKAINEQLKAADDKVEPYVGRFREELFASMKERRDSPYYRLTIGRMLLTLHDSAMTRRIVDEIAHDDFLAFPRQLFIVTYLIAQADPQGARPLLRQMLKESDGDIFLAQHFMTMDWPSLLVSTFGVAGPAAIDDLVAAAEGSDSVMRDNATHVLVTFRSPRLVEIIMKKIDAAPDAAERKRLINRLSSIYLPQTIEALKTLQSRELTSGEASLVRLSLRTIKPPTTEPFQEKEGIAITDPAIKTILFRNLELTHGAEVSFITKTILRSSTKADIPALERIRSSILFRLSDEAIDDFQSINAIIDWLRWQEG
jgi:tetratricopeptide (TPR) repeat protein